MEEVRNFIDTYNLYLKVKSKKFDDVEFIKTNTGVSINDYENVVYYYFNAFVFPEKYNYSGYVFVEEPNPISDKLIHFATHLDYNLFYVYSTDDGIVSLWDIETEEIEWHCSKSIDVFFSSMNIVLQTKIKMLKENNFDLDQDYLKRKYDKCMNLNDNQNDYSEFYDHILGL